MAVSDYVIMLDDLMEVYYNYWPISDESDDIDEVRRARQHSGTPSQLIPRDEARMELKENKSLMNAQNGSPDHGGIYQVLRDE